MAKMKVGHLFDRGGFLYRCAGDTEIFDRRRGFCVALRVEGFCADCGALFDFKATNSRLREKNQSRRCEKHRSPGSVAVPTLDGDMAAAREKLEAAKKQRGHWASRVTRRQVLEETWSAYEKRARGRRRLAALVALTRTARRQQSASTLPARELMAEEMLG